MVNIWRSEEYHVLNCYSFVVLPLHRRDKFLCIKVYVIYIYFKFPLVSKKEWYQPSKIQYAKCAVLNPNICAIVYKRKVLQFCQNADRRYFSDKIRYISNSTIFQVNITYLSFSNQCVITRYLLGAHKMRVLLGCSSPPHKLTLILLTWKIW